MRDANYGRGPESPVPVIVLPLNSLAIDRPFVDRPPAPQNALAIFAGEWASRFPAPLADVPGTGPAPLFEDPRIAWADERLHELGRGMAGASILELGPLEGGHTHLMSKAGAREIIAIEANARAYLKCLVAKEVMGIERANILLGDALPFLAAPPRRFDLGVACAFLNHFVDPLEVVEGLARCCDAVFIWNVVYHPSLFERQPELRPSFGPPVDAVRGEFKHRLFPMFYGDGIDYRQFWGGTKPSCCWMESDEILRALRHFGFANHRHSLEDNPFGKALSVVATR